MELCLTIAKLNALGPCSYSGRRVRAALRKLNPDKDHCFTAAEARQAGCTFDDIVWAASAASMGDKAVERRVRHWLADCAARVLPIYEKTVPDDNRVRDAIKAARAFADGKISAAARDAARDAARAAAWAAARAAAGAAAWAAAGDTAWAAAGDTARDAAGDTARAAARAAARDAAGDTARAAARAAARDAAWAAAGDTARHAEENWQFDRLVAWLSDPEPKPLRLPAKPKAAALKEAA